jgi:hypothetical protein
MTGVDQITTHHWVETDRGEKVFALIPGDPEDIGRAYIVVCPPLESFHASSRLMAETLIRLKFRSRS